MATIDAAFDNIRLIRRKILIAQSETQSLPVGHQRDEVLIRLSGLTDDLIRALHDFADMGFEEEVAALLQSKNDRSLSARCS